MHSNETESLVGEGRYIQGENHNKNAFINMKYDACVATGGLSKRESIKSA